MVIWSSPPDQPDTSVEIQSESESKTPSTTSVNLVEDICLSMKKIEQNPEPKITMVPSSWQNIVVFLCVVAGYASFFVGTEELQISDTFIMNVTLHV